MVWLHLKIFWHGEDNSAGGSERNEKERKSDKDIIIEHQVMDRNGK